MTDESTNRLSAEVAAMEVVLLALMERIGRDAEFWDRVDEIAAKFTGLSSYHPSTGIPQMGDLALSHIDHWRAMVGPNGREMPP